jgi:5-methylthioadenosine/S-adenosylhomocysteine deaminase
MANLNGHGAGNGGHSQGEPTDTAPVLDPTERAGAGDGRFVYRASPRPYAVPELLTSRDVIRFATVQGAKDLKLDRKVGSLTPGKEADILLLDATALNVAPLNHVPGAVVTLMDRSNVDTVIVAGKVRKWKGRLLSANLAKLRGELEVSRDYLFKAADVRQDLFRN